jgi:uncharacterized glyoxalase superfamily protein PhnB
MVAALMGRHAMSDSAKTAPPAVRTLVPMTTPRFDMIGVVVADMAAALDFYRALGLDIPPDADGQPHVDITLPSGMRMAWDTHETIRSFDPSWNPPKGGGHTLSLAFDCGDAAGVDATHGSLVATGYRSHLDPFDAFWGQRYATVLDPDGNGVDLFAPLAT